MFNRGTNSTPHSRHTYATLALCTCDAYNVCIVPGTRGFCLRLRWARFVCVLLKIIPSRPPRFATDARAFEQLCHRLERRGIASVVVPIRWYHWLPTLGGRSVRPILDRIHETVIRYATRHTVTLYLRYLEVGSLRMLCGRGAPFFFLRLSP